VIDQLPAPLTSNNSALCLSLSPSKKTTLAENITSLTQKQRFWLDHFQQTNVIGQTFSESDKLHIWSGKARQLFDTDSMNDRFTEDNNMKLYFLRYSEYAGKIKILE